MEPVEGPGIRDKAQAFRLEYLPDGLLTQLRVAMCLGVRDALVQQPGVQFVVALDPQPWGEEALPHQTNLVLDLALLPAGRRIAGHRVH